MQGHKSSRPFLWLFGCAFPLLVGASLPASGNFQYGIPLDQALVYNSGETSNLREYDPATTHGSGNKVVFSGLVSFDPQLNLVPDLAEGWEVDPLGTVYTFHLRSNAKFHDGRPVTARDVVYSWERALSPHTASDTAITYLGDILGAQDFSSGTAPVVNGLHAIDDRTLQVTLDAPKPYFLLKLTYPTAFVVDKADVEGGPDWVRSPNGTGPYRLTEWESNSHILYEANPEFYLGVPSIPYVLIRLYAGVDVRLYETDEIDIAGVNLFDAGRFQDVNEPLHGELLSGVNLCTGYVVFDASQPPFEDVNVRKAFSMAFDRERFIEVVLRGQALPAHGPYPPGLPGFDYGLQGLPYDPPEARRLLEESTYGGPQGLPPIVYTDSGFGSTISADVAAMAEMWEQNLDVTITVENLEYDFFFDQIYSGNHGQMFRGGWCADYPDPENFADVLFHSRSVQNNGNYLNSELDSLLERARTERDVQERIRMYQEAERLIVQDAPVLFTTHSLSFQLVKPYVKGFVFTPIAVPIERYMWLEGK
jgi:oligopeptide transport system substrate-binding protein